MTWNLHGIRAWVEDNALISVEKVCPNLREKSCRSEKGCFWGLACWASWPRFIYTKCYHMWVAGRLKCLRPNRKAEVKNGKKKKKQKVLWILRNLFFKPGYGPTERTWVELWGIGVEAPLSKPSWSFSLLRQRAVRSKSLLFVAGVIMWETLLLVNTIKKKSCEWNCGLPA